MKAMKKICVMILAAGLFLSAVQGGAAPKDSAWLSAESIMTSSIDQASDGQPIGMISIWATAQAIPDGWLECNGQAVDAAKYPEYVAKFGATTPDYRGFFLRGHGGKSGALGVAQDYAVQTNGKDVVDLSGLDVKSIDYLSGVTYNAPTMPDLSGINANINKLNQGLANIDGNIAALSVGVDPWTFEQYKAEVNKGQGIGSLNINYQGNVSSVDNDLLAKDASGKAIPSTGVLGSSQEQELNNLTLTALNNKLDALKTQSVYNTYKNNFKSDKAYSYDDYQKKFGIFNDHSYNLSHVSGDKVHSTTTRCGYWVEPEGCFQYYNMALGPDGSWETSSDMRACLSAGCCHKQCTPSSKYYYKIDDQGNYVYSISGVTVGVDISLPNVEKYRDYLKNRGFTAPKSYAEYGGGLSAYYSYVRSFDPQKSSTGGSTAASITDSSPGYFNNLAVSGSNGSSGSLSTTMATKNFVAKNASAAINNLGIKITSAAGETRPVNKAVRYIVKVE